MIFVTDWNLNGIHTMMMKMKMMGGMTSVVGWVKRESLNHFEKEQIKGVRVTQELQLKY